MSDWRLYLGEDGTVETTKAASRRGRWIAFGVAAVLLTGYAAWDMAMARRLLMVAGGGGAFLTDLGSGSEAGVVELSTAPDGGWSWFGDPRAVYSISANKTFFAWVAGDSGDVSVKAYSHASETVSAETILHAALEVDDHVYPSLLVRSDGKILAFYSPHLGSTVYKRLSTNAGDIGSFAVEVSLDAQLGGTAYTYPSPLLTTQADDTIEDAIWLFFRDHVAGVAGWKYAASSDGGNTFSGTTHLHSLTYSKIATNGDRIDVFCSDHPLDGATKVYHLYRENAAWHKSDGTIITGLPFDGLDLTTIYDGGLDNVWVWDIAYGADGYPRVTFVRFASTTDHRYMYGRWTGSAWEVNEIVAGGSYIPTSVEYPSGTFQHHYSGGVVLDHADPNVVWASVGVGADTWELRRYITADGGSSWNFTTIKATGKNVRPSAVRDSAAGLRVVWMTASGYTNYVTYSAGVSGVGD